MFHPWPNVIVHILAVLLLLGALLVCPWKELPRTAWIPPVAFLGSQIVATLSSSEPSLSLPVLWLDCSLVCAYLLGALVARDGEKIELVTLAWLAAGILLAWSGIYQAAVGLKEVEVALHRHPDLVTAMPRISDWSKAGRIYATFTSPNLLGGYILSAFFVILAWCLIPARQAASAVGGDHHDPAGVAQQQHTTDRWATWLGGMLGLLPLLYCFWHSQSKGSYGVLFLTLCVAIILLTRRQRISIAVIAALIALFVAGFILGYGRLAWTESHRTGAARLEFWRAAWQIGCDHPVAGSGPGTFAIMYPRYKKPETEPTRFVHNTYLQMWSDSGFAGFATFAVWLPGSLWLQRWKHLAPKERLIPTLLWCACLGFALHSLVDFDYYSPGNSWPIFLLLGYLAGCKPGKVEGPPSRFTSVPHGLFQKWRAALCRSLGPDRSFGRLLVPITPMRGCGTADCRLRPAGARSCGSKHPKWSALQWRTTGWRVPAG